MEKGSKEILLKKLKESGKWNKNYDYSKLEYINAMTKVIIIDKKFNTEHLIRPIHLLKGVLCCSKNLKNGYYTFTEAKAFIQMLNIKSQEEWKVFCTSGNRPYFIPSEPHLIYKNSGWIDLYDWLGTNGAYGKNKKNLTFDECRLLVHKLNLKSPTEFKKWWSLNKPVDVPSNPNRTYSDKGWLSWSDFLGTKINFSGMLNFVDAKKYIHRQKISNWRKYVKSGKRPNNIPHNPSQVYKEWVNMNDWLGIKNGFNGEWRPFNEARHFVHGLGLKTGTKWIKYCKSGDKPNDIPNHPREVYKEWISNGDWLGTGRVADQLKEFVSYEEAKAFVNKLGFKNQYEWTEYCKSGNKPHYIPANPSQYYKNNK